MLLRRSAPCSGSGTLPCTTTALRGRDVGQRIADGLRGDSVPPRVSTAQHVYVRAAVVWRLGAGARAATLTVAAHHATYDRVVTSSVPGRWLARRRRRQRVPGRAKQKRIWCVCVGGGR